MDGLALELGELRQGMRLLLLLLLLLKEELLLVLGCGLGLGGQTLGLRGRRLLWDGRSLGLLGLRLR